MLISTLTVAALAIMVERAVETQFGIAGVIGLMVLRTGLRKRNVTCVCVGLTVLVMLAVNV
ncbi:hypothetical protein GCM10009716_45300 [Streptomyces sodiiphilus]|uniref:Uncharacterized protein n=1 Tax=Streptomyces sodiiphilus TaxID=226217 RepID=A0ABN2PUZ2_9ACTN